MGAAAAPGDVGAAAAPAREPWHRRRRVPLFATVCVLPLYALWAVALATGGGDLAAQEAWAGFAARHPGSAYNLSWHGGLHTGAYSLISPYVMAAFGVVPVTVASGLVSTWLAGRLWAGSGLHRACWPALLAGLMLWCQAASGRTTFLLGAAFGLAAVRALVSGHRAGGHRAGGHRVSEDRAREDRANGVRANGRRVNRDPANGRRASRRRMSRHRTSRRRGPVIACWAVLATMASPVAGLFLLVVGAAGLLTSRRAAAAAATLLPPAAVLGLTAWLFPFQGEQPMPLVRLWPPLLMGVAAALAAPRSWRTVRAAAAVYAVGVGLTYLFPSPVGTNVERLAHLAVPPLLLAAALADGVHRRFLTVRRGSLALALLLSVAWVGGNTAAHIGDTARVPAWAAQTGGVVRALERLGADRSRVEVVMARSHREAAVLAPYVPLARGWNRQADVERGRLFYEGTLTEASYRAWLDRWAVGFVVLHAGPLDAASEREHALVASGPAYLQAVWRDANWRVYRVSNPTPLVTAPASVVRSDRAEVVVRMPRPGTVTLRIAYSPWLRAAGGCLAPAGADGGLTRLTVARPGNVTIGSAYRAGDRRCAA
ncbi:hypothetical protein [Streptomyces sp. NPDC051211]|uniref:hypothetical protein n=1 Tax=Streptomyces sp. NPDC051211 TaxID=3154643 RepID=UPI00344F0F1A